MDDSQVVGSMFVAAHRRTECDSRGSGVVGYNVQVAVDTEHHLIAAHEVTNSGSGRAQLANIAKQGVLTRPRP